MCLPVCLCSTTSLCLEKANAANPHEIKLGSCPVTHHRSTLHALATGHCVGKPDGAAATTSTDRRHPTAEAFVSTSSSRLETGLDSSCQTGEQFEPFCAAHGVPSELKLGWQPRACGEGRARGLGTRSMALCVRRPPCALRRQGAPPRRSGARSGPVTKEKLVGEARTALADRVGPTWVFLGGLSPQPGEGLPVCPPSERRV